MKDYLYYYIFKKIIKFNTKGKKFQIVIIAYSVEDKEKVLFAKISNNIYVDSRINAR